MTLLPNNHIAQVLIELQGHADEPTARLLRHARLAHPLVAHVPLRIDCHCAACERLAADHQAASSNPHHAHANPSRAAAQPPWADSVYPTYSPAAHATCTAGGFPVVALCMHHHAALNSAHDAGGRRGGCGAGGGGVALPSLGGGGVTSPVVGSPLTARTRGAPGATAKMMHAGLQGRGTRTWSLGGNVGIPGFDTPLGASPPGAAAGSPQLVTVLSAGGNAASPGRSPAAQKLGLGAATSSGPLGGAGAGSLTVPPPSTEALLKRAAGAGVLRDGRGALAATSSGGLDGGAAALDADGGQRLLPTAAQRAHRGSFSGLASSGAGGDGFPLQRVSMSGGGSRLALPSSFSASASAPGIAGAAALRSQGSLPRFENLLGDGDAGGGGGGRIPALDAGGAYGSTPDFTSPASHSGASRAVPSRMAVSVTSLGGRGGGSGPLPSAAAVLADRYEVGRSSSSRLGPVAALQSPGGALPSTTSLPGHTQISISPHPPGAGGRPLAVAMPPYRSSNSGLFVLPVEAQPPDSQGQLGRSSNSGTGASAGALSADLVSAGSAVSKRASSALNAQLSEYIVRRREGSLSGAAGQAAAAAPPPRPRVTISGV